MFGQDMFSAQVEKLNQNLSIICHNMKYSSAFVQNSPKKQTQASDLSLEVGGACLTAAQHGCLQGHKFNSASSKQHKSCTMYSTRAAMEDRLETCPLCLALRFNLWRVSNDRKICCCSSSMNLSAFRKASCPKAELPNKTIQRKQQ